MMTIKEALEYLLYIIGLPTLVIGAIRAWRKEKVSENEEIVKLRKELGEFSVLVASLKTQVNQQDKNHDLLLHTVNKIDVQYTELIRDMLKLIK